MVAVVVRTHKSVLFTQVPSDTVSVLVTARTSPVRRRLTLLLPLTSLLVAGSLGPLPVAQAQQPATVTKTVDVRLGLMGSVVAGPSPLLEGDNGSVGALVPTRTPFAPVCSSMWSTMVAFVWNQRGGPAIRPAVETPWGERITTIDDTDAEPDTGTPESHPARRVSDLYWTRGSHCVRLSLRMPAGSAVSGLRAMFLNTSGSAAGPGTGHPDAAPTATTGGAQQPPMVTRAQWGAAKPRKNCFGYEPYIKMAYVHHTSGSNGYSPAQSDDIVRGIQAYHEYGRGFCDIAYNFLVDRYGTIYVGRYDSDNTSVNVNPGSQMGFNPYTFSVSAMGNFQPVSPPAALVTSVERVLAWRLDVAHLDPLGHARMTSTGGSTTRYHRGQAVRLPLISGHRRTGITDCPGNRIWWRLGAIRRAVFQMGMPKFFDPRQSATKITPGRGTDRIQAEAPLSLEWKVDVADPNGTVVDTLTDSGRSLDVEWDGTDSDGVPVLPGSYQLNVQAQTTSGAVARGATFSVAVDSIFPLPAPA